MLSKKLKELKANTKTFCKKACCCATICSSMMITSVCAADYASNIRSILQQMIGIIETIFQAVGVVLSVYAVGSLVLAFRNEDANSKSNSSTLLVVGIVLIAIPAIIDGLNLVDMITAN